MEITLRLRLLSYAVFCLLFLPFLGYSFDEKSPKKSRKNKESYSSPKDDLKPLPKLVLKSGNPVFLKNFFLADETPKEIRPVKWVESANMVDCIRYEIVTDKKNVKTGEEILVTVRLAFADGLPIAWRDEDCERLSIKVVFPKSFQQTGGNYSDFMPIRFDDNNKSFEITIKGIFLKPEANGEFMLLKGPPTSNWETTFIKKKELFISATGKDLSNTIAKTTNKNVASDVSIKDSTPQRSVTDDCPTPTATGSTVCIGSTINLSASGGTTYSWVGPNSFTSTEANVDIENAIALNAGIYTVTVSDGTCTATATASVVVNTLPTASITVTTSTVCQGATIEMSGSGGTSYSWVGPNSFSSSDDEVSITNASAAMDGVYTLTVANSSGCTATATASINVTVITPPVIEASLAEICLTESPTSVTLTSTGCNGGTVLWSTSETGTSIQVSPLMTGTYSATCQLSGCTSLPSNVISITVKNRPPAPTISANKTVLVTNETATLTATGCSGTISWSNGMTGSSIGVTTNSAVTITATCALDGCVSNSSNSVTLTPCASFKPTLTQQSITDYCATGKTVTLSAPQSCFTGSLKAWRAERPDGSTIFQDQNSATQRTFNVTEPTIYKVQCFTWNGCTSLWSDGVEVTASGASRPSLSIGGKTIYSDLNSIGGISNRIDMCLDETITITATGCESGVYAWSNFASGFNATTNSGTLTFTPTSTTGAYKYVFCSNNGCVSSAYELYIGVSNRPSAGVVTPSVANICLGQSQVISTSSSGANSIFWYKADGTLVVGYNGYVNAGISVNPTTTTSYYAVRNADNRGQCQSAPSNIVTINVSSATPTTQSITASATSICTGSSENITLTSSTCDGTVNWSWTNSAGSSGTVNSVGDLVVSGLTSTTTYKSKCTNGCGTSASWSPTVTITVFARPTITGVGASLTICTGSSINLTASGGTTYSWAGPDSFSSSTQNPTISSATSAMQGVYTVTVTNADNCSATATTNVTVNSTPTAPTISANKTVLGTNETATLTATGCSGTISWSNGMSGSSIGVTTNSIVIITATCTLNGCVSANSNTVTLTPCNLTQPTAELLSTYTNSSCRISAYLKSSGCTAYYEWLVSDINHERIYNAISSSPNFSDYNQSQASYYKVRCSSNWSSSYGFDGCKGQWSNEIFVPGPASESYIPTLSADKPLGNDIYVSPFKGYQGIVEVCSYEPITITASGCTGIYQWKWQGVITNGGNTFTAIPPPDNGSGSVLEVSCIVNGCTSPSSHFSISALAKPSPPVLTTVTNNICTGGLFVINPTNIVNIQWSIPPSSIYYNPPNPPVVRYYPSQSTSYYAYNRSNSGCYSEPSNIVTANVSTTVPAIQTIAVSASSICIGSTVTLTSSTCDGTVNWSWTNSAGSSGTVNSVGDLVVSGLTSTTTYKSKCTNGCGTSANWSPTVTITVLPKPTITGISASLNTCLEGNINLTASGGATYSWAGPESFSSSSQNPTIPNASSAMAGVYTVTVTNADNCLATATTNVIVNELPTPTASATANSVCIGNNINLTASGGTSYSWVGPESFSSSSHNPTINNATSAMAGIYTVTVTNANNCSATATTSITINSLPTTSITVTNSTVCQGATIEMNGNGGTSYSWVGPNSFSSSDEEISISNASALMTGIYTLAVENSSGCLATATASITVTVITPPTIEASVVEICLTETPTFATLTATGCSGGTVLWSTSEAGTSIQVSPLITGTYSATCQIGGCESLPSNVIELTVKNRPPAPTISANKTVLVANETATLTATGCSGTVSWSNGMTGSSIGVTTNSTITITATCALNDCVSDNSNSITLTACTPPTITGVTASISICFGAPINLTATGGNIYSWAGPNGYTSTAQNPTISTSTFIMAGTYTVTVTNTEGCSGTATTNVIVKPLPTATANSTNANVCQGGTIQLTATGGGTYLWSGPGGFSGTTSSVNITHATIPMSGIYTVTVTNANNCSATATTNISVANVLTVSATGSTVCTNTTATVLATGGSTYAWIGPNGFSASGQTVNINNASLSAAGVYTVTVSNVNNCTATATAMVIINPVGSTQTITASKISVCTKSNENITLTSTVCTGTVNWQWTSSAGSGTAVGNPITISNLSADVTYKSKCTNNCGISTDWSDPVTITLLAAPVITSISSNTPIINEGDPINFALIVTNAESYSWAGPHSFTSTLQNPTVTGTTEENTGIYTVTVTSSSGCTFTATTFVEVNKDCKCTTCGTDGEGLSTINPTANPDFTIPSELQARNFIVENTYLDEVDHTKVVQNVSYMDGLGRGNQNIRRGVGGQGEDIVSVTEYDNFGRETKKYLPYPKAGTNGYYVEGAASGIANYYQTLKGDNHVYAETEFEGSALQRVKKQGNVGVAWQLDATTPHVISFDYRANTTADAVMSLNYDFDTKKLKIVAAAYPAGELTVTITTNENGQIAREFKNREGQVICKDEATNDAANTTRTYYVFDDLGLLRFVITPKAETELKTRAVSSLININPNGGDFFLKNQVYYYDYDANGLLIESAVPGMQVVKQMIYNKRDQLVLTVGANTFNPDNRIYNKYDDLNRLVSSGLYTGNESVETMRTSAAGNTTWPTSNLTEYLRNYYDNLTTNNYPSGEQVAFSTSGYNSSYSSDLQGKLVGTKTKIFSYAGHILTSTSNSVKRIELLSTNYYDDEGRLIQVASKNHKDGLDYTHKKFDFIGREIASKTTTEFKHWTNSTTTTTQTKIIETKSTFDAGSRIKSICQKNDSDAWEPVQRNNYNGIGELSSKLQGCSIQKVDYTYNMRGWLTDINDLSGFSAQATSSNPDLFAMHLDYNGTGQYLGNITGQQWRTLKKQNATPSTQETYTYTYDNLNRLLTGTYTGERGGLSTEIYGTTPYDKIGNIQKLKRTKITDVNTVVDDLTYTYYAGSVTLQKITDSGDKNSFFKEPDNNNNDYTYDFNGNLSVDKNKYYEYSNGAGGINHNALGLLARLSSNNSNPDAGAQVTVRNYYTGRGEKIRSEIASIESGEAVLKSTDYIAGLIWTNNSTVTSTPAVLDFIPTAEGRVVLTSSIYGSVTPPEGLPLHRYEYHLKDHLGNLRAAYRCGDPKRDTEGNILTESEAGIEQVTLVQEIHYDPLGVTFGNEAETQIPETLSQRWQYYGKEKVTDANLNWLDFDVRFYDPIIGRWHAASNANNHEALSPYYFSHTPARLDVTYKFNNSIKKIKDFAKWRKPVSSVYN